MSSKKKQPLVLSFLFIFSTLSPSGIFAQSSEKNSNSNQLIVSGFQKLSPINPILTGTTLSANLIDAIYDGLIQLDERLVPLPHLAKSWAQSEDGLTWNFYLRKGVMFHDGIELTAEDVAFTIDSIKKLKEAVRWSYVFQEIEEIIVKETHVLQVKLKKPLATFLQNLHFGILPKHLLKEKDLTTFLSTEEVIGTGPYKLKSLSEEVAVLKANENYFLGKPKVEEIYVQIYPNQEAVWAKAIAGHVDYFEYFTPKTFETLRQVPGFNFHPVPKPYYYPLAFNLKDPILSDLKVRQALNYAINRNEIIAKALNGRGEIATGTILPGSWAHNPEAPSYPYNPKKAAALLKEAGWVDHDGDHLLDKDGKTLQLSVHINVGDDLKKKVIRLIEQQLLDIGIQLNIIFVNATDINFLFKKDFQIVFIELVAIPGPDSSYIFWHGSQIERGFNFFSYNNETVNHLLDAGRIETDPNKRRVIYFKFQEEMHRDPPGVFLFWTERLIAVHERFRDVKIGPFGGFKNIRNWSVQEANHRSKN